MRSTGRLHVRAHNSKLVLEIFVFHFARFALIKMQWRTVQGILELGNVTNIFFFFFHFNFILIRSPPLPRDECDMHTFPPIVFRFWMAMSNLSRWISFIYWMLFALVPTATYSIPRSIYSDISTERNVLNVVQLSHILWTYLSFSCAGSYSLLHWVISRIMSHYGNRFMSLMDERTRSIKPLTAIDRKVSKNTVFVTWTN